MRKKIATIGVVIIMLGAALVLAGFTTLDKAPVNIGLTPSSGGYSSDIIDYSSGDVLIITGSTGHAGLVNYSEIAEANSTNIRQESISPYKNTSSGIEYKGLTPGRYVYIMFTSSKPASFGFSLESSAEFSDLHYALYAFEGGIVAFLGGIGVIITGFILKPKPKIPTKAILQKKGKK
jgi:hypothetical protein